MALRTKTREQLYQMHTYRSGRIEVLPLRGFFHTVEKIQGHNVSIPDLIVTALADVDSNDDVDASGTGRLYFAWAFGGDADVIVQLTDNNIVIACFKVTAGNAAEAYFYNSTNGVGIAYGTDLEVNAVLASDGTTPAATTARPDVVVVSGDDAVNTDDANLINTIYG